MTKDTKDIIIKTSKKLFASQGYEGFSMRTLSKECGVGLSSIYHFFEDKDVLLEYIFNTVNKDLGKKRAKLPNDVSANEMLRQRIIFQFDNIEDIVFILKYYLHFRKNFKKNDDGYVPTKAYLHIEEVLVKGVRDGDFCISKDDINKEAKVITHAINGYLLEYYPSKPKRAELDSIVNPINEFMVRSLTNKEVVM